MKKFYILGVRIDALNFETLLPIIEKWILKREKRYIVLTGAHGIVGMQKDEQLKRINNRADLVAPDGTPEVWLGKIKGVKKIEKICAYNIMDELFRFGTKRGYRHFFYGSTNEVLKKMTANLRQKYSDIQIVGSYSPPFRPLESQEKKTIVKIITKSHADIVWCGLGCPKQEKWANEFRPIIASPVIIGVGAGFDFYAGTLRAAPRWIANSGFEWLYRLILEPKRLAKRYFTVIPIFIFLNLLEALKLKKFKS